MITNNNISWMRRVFPDIAEVKELNICQVAGTLMNSRAMFTWSDFEIANDLGVEFTIDEAGCGYRWEDHVRHGIKDWLQAIIAVMETINGDEFRHPNRKTLRDQGWRAQLFGQDGAAFLYSIRTGRSEPLYHDAGSAWDALAIKVGL